MVNYDTLMDNYLEPLSRRAYDGASSDVVKDRILAARQFLVDNVRNSRLSPEEAAKVKNLDIKNFDVNRIREAIKGVAGEEEGITISKLASAYAGKSMPGNTTADQLIGPTVRTLGRTPRQDEARTALITALRIAGLGGAGTVTGLTSLPAAAATIGGLYGVSALGQTAGGARALLGQMATQQRLVEALRAGAVAPAVTTLGD
jgi:hypothetical protein